MTTSSGGLGGQLDRARLPVRVAYAVVVFLATLSWFEIDADPSAVARRAGRMLELDVSARDVIDGARNLLLFAGWGLVWMATAPAGGSWASLRNAVFSGAALSALVEVLQLLSDSRTASVLDLTTNTLGAAAGAVLLVVLVLALASRRSAKSYVGVPAAVLAVSVGVAVFGEAVLPLYRQTIEPWAMGGPGDRLAEALSRVRLGAPWVWPWADLLLFLPAGLLGVAALVEAGVDTSRSALRLTAASVPAFLLAEVAHGALGVEIFLGVVIVHVLAVGAGAWAATRGLPVFSRQFRGGHRPAVLLSLLAAWLFLWSARPYMPARSWGAIIDKWTGEWWIPLRFLGSRMDMFSVVDVVIGFFLLLPLGALLAVWPLRRRGPWAGVLPALYLAAGLEVGQTLVAGRTVDMTDFLVQAAGVVVGWVIVRRAGFRPYGTVLPLKGTPG